MCVQFFRRLPGYKRYKLCQADTRIIVRFIAALDVCQNFTRVPVVGGLQPIYDEFFAEGAEQTVKGVSHN